MELVCPAGNLPALRAAIDNGADAVYIGFRNHTNARNFPGLNFGPDEVASGVAYARERGKKVFLAINTYPYPNYWQESTETIDQAYDLGVDVMILADIGLMEYASTRHPDLRLHLSVQGSATSQYAIGFYHRNFGIQRAVVPRVLSLTQVQRLIKATPVEIEVFGYGSLCVMAEGRCSLSSYVTGESPNSAGVCSPAEAVRWVESPNSREVYLNNALINRYNEGEPAGYPTLCKGRFEVDGEVFHSLEEPTSLNVLEILPQLVQSGVAAIKVEGRQRSRAYVARVTRTLRAALDTCLQDPERFQASREWIATLNEMSEGTCHTLGAYDRPWQ
ncbi:MAG: U32 family peptidase [Pseudomonadales bacterium]|nr:U32 family peptidase [Pseudomonadales bacterium]